jgi:tetratricopeptide (TPR) repeat protein
VQDKAVEALRRAASFDPPAPPWSVAWFSGTVNKQNGYLDEAIESFRGIVELDDAATRERGFDFSLDYRLLNELGQTLFERAKQERGDARHAERVKYLEEAKGYFEKALEIDPENDTAHYNLDLLYKQLGQPDKAKEHSDLYLKYKVDDNARDRAVSAARAKDPAANHAAEAIVIYDLRRAGAEEFELGPDGLKRAAEPYERLAIPGPPAPPPDPGEVPTDVAQLEQAAESATAPVGLLANPSGRP